MSSGRFLVRITKDLNYFEGHERIAYGILKTIQEFTLGYEVSRCPLKLWVSVFSG